jgi:hypothetical protein
MPKDNQLALSVYQSLAFLLQTEIRRHPSSQEALSARALLADLDVAFAAIPNDEEVEGTSTAAIPVAGKLPEFDVQMGRVLQENTQIRDLSTIAQQ